MIWLGKPATGVIQHVDLTVDDAPSIRDFYASVVGWEIEDMEMGEYQDRVLNSRTAGDGGSTESVGSRADFQW